MAAEITRRAELHALDVKIKREELLTKQHMTTFWQLATHKLAGNEIRIGDIVSMAAMQSQPFSATEIINLDASEIECADGTMFTGGDLNVEEQALNLEIAQPASPSTMAPSIYVPESPFRMFRNSEQEQIEHVSDTTSSEDDEPEDDELADPSFQLK